MELKLEERDIISESFDLFEKGFLDNQKYEVIVNQNKLQNLDYGKNFRVIKIDKFVYEKDENLLDKLSNVYTSLYGNGTSLFLILNSNGKKCDFYIGVKDKEEITQSFNTLKSSLNGNFSGMVFGEPLENQTFEELTGNILSDDVMEITTVLGVPTLKIEEKDKFLQGIEKLVDGMEGKEFSAIFLADPVEYSEIKRIKEGYENISTQLALFKSRVTTLSESEAMALSNGFSENFSKSYTESVSKTNSVNSGETKTTGVTKGFNIGANIGAMLGSFIPKGVTENDQTTTNSYGLGASVGYSKNKTKSFSSHIGRSTSDTRGESYTESRGTTTNKSETETKTQGYSLQISEENKSIVNMLKKIDNHLSRLEKGEGSGLWQTGAYFISKTPQNSVVAGNIYNGLVRGEASGIDRNIVHTFNDEKVLGRIMDSLYNFTIPEIYTKDLEMTTNLSTMVTTEELTLKINLPKKSVVGLEVLEMVSFGRNRQQLEKKGISVGKMYHLGKESEIPLELDINSLASHTFVTGSTGSGKSNAVYTILNELKRKNIKFMVVEPAKGEYKNVFGGLQDVNVYGTNSNFTELLKINPFSFNKDIHILEHIDRLIEIFNACWPMYSAMPAILKEAIEKSYLKKGWELEHSINLLGENRYPDFADLKESLENVINSSAYSQEVKSNYIGALVTRVNSLATGLLKNVFVKGEIDEIKLFDENTIIDISRIPSAETKSLIMGIVFMKLQEYRMSTAEVENSELKHVTVLEEAHNLLKRVSTSQSQEGANLQGKSVEMITNAIAEMRTYGEGFIIADQAPGLLDESVIRNTNTKICLKLPNKDDRELVGRAMNLDDNQIDELSKLQTGVGAVIQSSWGESVLIKFNKMEKYYKYIHNKNTNSEVELKGLAIKYLLREKIEKIGLGSDEIEKVEKYLIEKGIELRGKINNSKILYNLLNGNLLFDMVNEIAQNDVIVFKGNIGIILNNYFKDEDKNIIEDINREVSRIILRESINNNEVRERMFNDFCDLVR